MLYEMRNDLAFCDDSKFELIKRMYRTRKHDYVYSYPRATIMNAVVLQGQCIEPSP